MKEKILNYQNSNLEKFNSEQSLKKHLKNIQSLIKLPLLEILEEDETGYKVKLGEKEYTITNGNESCFYVSGGIGTGLHLRQELTMLQIEGIFQDKNAPIEFIKLMMLHEIMEKEYTEAGFDNAHDRALNDEILYAMKFLSPKEQQEYFKWAEDYRAKKIKKEQLTESTENQIEKEKIFRLQYGTPVTGYFRANIITTNPNLANELEERKMGKHYGGSEFTDMHENDTLFKNAETFGIPFIILAEEGSQFLSYAKEKKAITHLITYNNENVAEKIDYVCDLIDELHKKSGLK